MTKVIGSDIAYACCKTYPSQIRYPVRTMRKRTRKMQFKAWGLLHMDNIHKHIHPLVFLYVRACLRRRVRSYVRT